MARGSEGKGDGFEAALEALGEDPGPAALQAFLDAHGRDVPRLIETLRRPIASRLLELVGDLRALSDDARVAGALVQNPRTPQHVARRLVPGLYWRDLAAAATNPWISAGVRQRAEGLLLEQLREMRLGDRVALARMAGAAVLRALLAESDERVLEGALFNPRLQEPLLLQGLRSETATRALFEAVARSPRWRSSYGVRLELALQSRTPLPIALAQVTSLVPADLRRVAQARSAHPLVRAAAERAAAPGAPRNSRR